MTTSAKKRAHKKRPSSKLHIRKLFVAYAACIVVSAVAAAVISSQYRAEALPDPFNSQQRKAVSFTLYYPAKLPTPYYVDIPSVARLEQSVVTMRITDGSGKGNAFTVSQQALPEKVNLEALYESFAGRQRFSTPLGQATSGLIDDGTTRIVVLVSNDKTWLIVQAPSTVSLDVLQKTLGGLKPSVDSNAN
jgi:hypothetical protein